MINVNYTREEFEALDELAQIEAVAEVTRDTTVTGVKKIDNLWVTYDDVQIGFLTEYLNPVYSQTVCLEAVLRPEQVRAYAEEHKISFQESLKLLGKEYVSRYYQYSIVQIEGRSTGISYLFQDKESV